MGVTNSDIFDNLKDIIGEDNAEELVRQFSGERIYFKKMILKKIRNRKIKRDYWEDFKNYRELSNRYSLSISQIRRILHNK